MESKDLRLLFNESQLHHTRAPSTLDTMEHGRPSKTALRVAMRRAAHQLLDRPCVLHDPIAVPLLGRDFAVDTLRETHPVARAFRAFMAARSRWVEDRLAAAVAAGTAQYAVLGAGLDTFAWRNPFPSLRVFEVDFPATQEWKKSMLAEAGLDVPGNLAFVPVDFEVQALAERLAASGFDFGAPAFFGWLGVVPYLTLDAFRSTLATIAALPAGTQVAFDYALSPETFSPLRRMFFDALAARVARSGEPFKLFFTPEQLAAELSRAGFQTVEQADSAQLNELYFRNRSDGLELPTPGMGRMAAATV
jgi:methyltransferase (TIGR00027 family)